MSLNQILHDEQIAMMRHSSATAPADINEHRLEIDRIARTLARFTYPHRLLGRAVGINALVVAISAAVGPTVASAILAVGHWRWLFGVNVPIGLVAIAIAGFALPANELSKRRLNLVGALLNAATFGLLITGLQTLTHEHALALGATEIGGGLIAACLLIRREASRPAPLIPIDLLKIRLFGLSVATSICSFAAQMLAFVSLPFNFQERLGYSAVETGLLMTPWPIGVGVAAPLAGWLADRYPAGLLGGVGLAVMSGGRLLTGQSLLLGSGYGVVTWATEPGHAVLVMLAILALRCLATATSVAGGGSGGIFIPLVVGGALIGSMIGGAVDRADLTLFIVIGVAAFLGGGYRVPLAAVMFVAETTGRPSFIVPGLLAAVAAEQIAGGSDVVKMKPGA